MADNDFKFVYNNVEIFRGSKKEAKAALENYFKEAKQGGIQKYLDDLLSRTFVIGKRFLEHIEDGHIVIEIVNSKIPKYVLKNGKKVRNIERVAEEYSSFAGKGRSASSVKPPFQASVKSAGGFHILSKLDNKLVRITENIATKVLPTGETIRIAKIEYWIEEAGRWYPKEAIHTFFPAKWDIEKVERVVLEASRDCKNILGNKYHGVSKQGIKIEFYVDKTTKEIQTSYIIFE